MKKKTVFALAAILLCLSCVWMASCQSSDAQGSDTVSDASSDEQIDENTNGEEDDMQNTEIKTIADIDPSNGKKVKIAFVGDSITQGVGASNQIEDSYPGQLSDMLDKSRYTVGNFGKGSSYVIPMDSKYHTDYHRQHPELTYKNTQQYKDSVAFKPDVVVIMLGVNDVRSMSDIDGWSAIKDSIVSLAREYAEMDSVQKVYIATSIRICNATAIIQGCDGPLQEAQREAAKELGFDLIDIFSMTYEYMNVMMHSTADRVHPNEEIYGEMAKAMKAALLGEQYTPTVPERSSTGVVYVKAGGRTSGTGETPETALNSITKAAGLLRDGGGTIVICGPYSTTYEPHMPAHEGVITVTSKYNGTDYSASGAKLGLAHNLYLYGDYKFENIKLNIEVAASIICCNYNNVTFGDGITCALASSNLQYPLLLVGYNIGIGGVPTENISLKGECNITVNSGTWAYIRGGNRRVSGAYPMASSDKDAKLNITVNGGTYTNATGNNMTAVTGMGGFAGTATMTINGGVFEGDVFAVGRAGGNTSATKAIMEGSVHLIVNGGTFNGSIHATQDSTVTVTGAVKVTYDAKYENKLLGFTNKIKK